MINTKKTHLPKGYTRTRVLSVLRKNPHLTLTELMHLAPELDYSTTCKTVSKMEAEGVLKASGMRSVLKKGKMQPYSCKTYYVVRCRKPKLELVVNEPLELTEVAPIEKQDDTQRELDELKAKYSKVVRKLGELSDSLAYVMDELTHVKQRMDAPKRKWWQL